MKTCEVEIPDIHWQLIVRPEWESPEGHFASGDDEQDAQTVAKIVADSEWNEWAWCIVEVRGSWNGLEESAFLGGCSYENAEGFKAGGYYEDMQREVTDLINKQAEKIVSALA